MVGLGVAMLVAVIFLVFWIQVQAMQHNIHAPVRVHAQMLVCAHILGHEAAGGEAS